jgi:hypothetical protein
MSTPVERIEQLERELAELKALVAMRDIVPRAPASRSFDPMEAARNRRRVEAVIDADLAGDRGALERGKDELGRWCQYNVKQG